MAQTQIPWGDPKAVTRWSPMLQTDIQADGFFAKKFVGPGDNNIVQEKTELNSDSGDTISFDLVAHLRGAPTFGDDRLEGKEEQLRFHTDTVSIDQVRKGVSAGGRMTRKRVEHDLRKTAGSNLRRFWAKWIDEFHFMYLSGTRGINPGFTQPPGWSGFAGNLFVPPDPYHHAFGGAATSKATITAADRMTRDVIERLCVRATMMQADNPDVTNMVPLTIEGADRWLMLLSPYQSFDLRTDAGAGGWLDIQKAAMGAEGSNNKVFKGGLGMVNNCVLHEHQNAIRFNDYGAAGDLPAARGLFCGRQAGAIAYGTSKGNRFLWEEIMKDYRNEPSVMGGYIFGAKKCQFNGYDFGVMSVDTYARNPNPALMQ